MSRAAAEASARAVRPRSFVLAVDEGGQHHVAFGDELVIGHARSARADLPFLADVAAEHARLVRTATLRGGPGLRVVPAPGEPVLLGDRPVPPEGALLRPGERLTLAANLDLRLHAPDPASASLVLECLAGTECLGARRVILLAPGPGGRVRIGAGAQCHVRVARLGVDVALELGPGGGSLVISSDAGVATYGASRAPRVTLPCPPRVRVDVVVGERAPDEPPFALAFLPIELFEDAP